MISFFLLQVSITILLIVPIVLMRHAILLTGESYFRTMLCHYRIKIYVITMAICHRKFPINGNMEDTIVITVSDSSKPTN